MNKIEYRVKPVTRYIVTEYEEAESGYKVSQIGEYDNEFDAKSVADAFAIAARSGETWQPEDGDVLICHDDEYWVLDDGQWLNVER